jgi:nickel/cobalt exporter
LLNDRSAMVLLALAFSNALLHALIPSHWLSFAVVGRANRWPVRTTLTVTALAGAGHVLLTIGLGLIVARVGKEAAHFIPPVAEHAAASAALIVLGITFLIRGLRRSGCQHPGHHHHEHGVDRSSTAAPGVVSALVLGITLSPCLDLLSIYLAAASFPWPVIAAVSVVMAVTTLSFMVGLVWLTLLGLQRLKLDWLERNEGFVVAGILIALGVYILFLH